MEEANPGRVLVADDDDLIRRLADRVLSRAGWDVTLAADSREALRCFDAAADGFDVAVLDLRLPGGSGVDLLQRFRRRDAGLAAVLTSGAPPDADHRAALDNPGVLFLHKPFSARSLLEGIEQVRAAGG